MTRPEGMPAGVPALSIRQPWASAIVAGRKDIENRSWSTAYRGPVLIHAALRADDDVEAIVDVCRRAGLSTDWLDDPAGLPRGGIIGRAELVAVVTASRSPWFFGPFGFLLRDVRPLPFASCRGALGLFAPDFTPPAPKPAPPPSPQLGLFGEGGA